MPNVAIAPLVTPPDAVPSIVERREHGLLVLSPGSGKVRRRILYINSYGGAETWDRITHSQLPGHHMWGCPELVRLGYEVALAEPLGDFYLYRKPLPHDAQLLSIARSWLGRDGIVYCGHNVLFWLPLLQALGALRCRIVSLLFGREPLAFARSHAGIIALNGAAAEHARLLAPRTRVARLAWGAALECFPTLPYLPRHFLACGQTCRDHHVLSLAALRSPHAIRVIAARLPAGLSWPPTATLITGGQRDDTVTYERLFHDYYAQCAAALVILQDDPKQYTGVGFTNLIEAMAMSRPVIVTRTGALPTEIDVEQAHCGLHVAPGDAEGLAAAIDVIASDPARSESMGRAGRALCERYYNIGRYAGDLHQFFETI